jgi:2-iminobutanoate/2-iminopropanoate deaminase
MSKATLLVLALAAPGAGLLYRDTPLNSIADGGQLPTKKYLTPDGKAKPGSFAAGLMVGKTAYVSGKGDYLPKAEFPDKVRNCLNEVRKTLQVGGLDMQHVVQSWVYLEDTTKFEEFNKIYGEVFKNDPPVRTTIGVARVPGESHLEITCVAYADLAERKRIGDVTPGLPFSPAIQAGDTLYVSGKGDQLPGGGHPATFPEQVRQTMRNVDGSLKQAGLDFRHVVMSYVFLDKYENLAVADKIYREFFKAGEEPACATVLVDWIPGGSHFEVTVTATADLAKRKVVRPAEMANGRIEGGVTASGAVWAGDTLYLSGLPGFKYKEGVLASGLADQIHQMARNHTAVLETAGLKLEDIVSGHVYLRDIKDYNALNKIYGPYYSKGPGVRTCLMPYSGAENNDVRVFASFIAARTQGERGASAP